METIISSIDKVLVSAEEKEKFCSKCKFVLGNRRIPENWRNWTCSKTQKETGINLVSGEKVFESSTCFYQRSGTNEESCGIKGKWFELYEYPKEFYDKISSAIPIKQKLSSLTFDDL